MERREAPLTTYTAGAHDKSHHVQKQELDKHQRANVRPHAPTPHLELSLAAYFRFGPLASYSPHSAALGGDRLLLLVEFAGLEMRLSRGYLINPSIRYSNGGGIRSAN